MSKPVRNMQKANAQAHARVLPKIPAELLDGLTAEVAPLNWTEFRRS